MSLAIPRIATAVPDTILSQEQALQVARVLACPTPEQDTWIPSTYLNTGIEKRHVVLSQELVDDILQGTRHSGSVYLPKGNPDDRGPTTEQRMQHHVELAPPLALAACRDALREHDPATITHLITICCTGFFSPGLDRLIVDQLGLPPTIARTNVANMGCNAAINGLRVANAFAGDPRARILTCAVETCSLHYYYSYNPSKMVANAIYGDGAAALVGVPASSAPAQAWKILATGSCFIPRSQRAMTWIPGDHGFEMSISQKLPSLIRAHLRPWLESWLGGTAVGTWGVLPSGPTILNAVEESLNLSPEDVRISREVFSQFGNVSSPTLLFILQRVIERDLARPCLLLGFGPGLVVEAALVG